jgi:ferrous iron transport protein B
VSAVAPEISVNPGRNKNKDLKIALAGNPNCGKTTLFNLLTGLNQKIGNYPGVTVDKKLGKCSLAQGKSAIIIDLPGTYSLYPASLDESVTHKILCDVANFDHPDIVVIIADSTNLKRNLLFATQVIDLAIPCVLVLNMIDLAEKNNLQIDEQKLSGALGILVVSIDARNNKGIDKLKKVLSEAIPAPTKTIFNPAASNPELSKDIDDYLKNHARSSYGRYQVACNYETCKGKSPELVKVSDILKKYDIDGKDSQNNETLLRYRFINALVRESVTTSQDQVTENFTASADKILTHKIYGFAIFLGLLFLIFQTIFNLSTYPMEVIEIGFASISKFLVQLLPAGWFTDLLTEGVLAGLSGIMVFIPQIAFLFAFIAILEDTGYMSRVSFIMDKMMRGLGLNGKSVIALLSGAACAVPSIMATRTIGNTKERLITILVVPLISCSARIPVYSLLIAMVFPVKNILGFFNLQGIALMGMYLIGFAAAIVAALLFKMFIKTSERSTFIMEMPVYRMPRWSSIGLTIYEKVKTFVVEAGKVIIVISIILWALSSFGPSASFENIEKKYATSQEMDLEMETQMASEKLEASYAGIFGKTIEPAIRPLGFDWKIGIALLTSFAAREVFVGTMATIYSVGDPDNTASLKEKMLSEKNPDTGKAVYSFATGLSLLIFFAFAMQCMSTLAVTYRETKSIKWPIIQLVYMSSLAYVSAFILYQTLS